MKIGIIGTGTVGKTLAAKFAAQGYEVLVANSRGLEGVVDSLGAASAEVTPGSTSEALACDVIFLTVPWTRVRDVLGAGGPQAGRILIDATNIFLSYPPEARIDDLGEDTGSEFVARLAPAARVVKAFNTLAFAQMFAPVTNGMKRVLFVAGDDGRAVATVAGLINELGLHALPLGSLAQAGRLMELGGPLSGLELLTAAAPAAT